MARFASGLLAALLLTAGPVPPPISVSHELTGSVTDHVVLTGDTLGSLGSRFGVDVATLAAANNLRAAARLQPGLQLRIDNRHIVAAGRGSIVINIPQRMLFLIEDGKPTAGFPAALGRPTWPTPTGAFTVATKEVDPTWDVPPSIQREMERAGRQPIEKVPPGPTNPLGDRWFGLSLPNLGIHGTNAPGSIYHHQTHGCIRLHPDDVHALFERVPEGAAGEIVYQPVLLAVVDGRIYLESHPDVYRRWPDAVQRVRSALQENGLVPSVDWARAVDVIRRRAGIACDVTAPGPSMKPSTR